VNRWQITFLAFGIIATVLIILFPPQFVTNSTVRFEFIGAGYPIDWLRLFLWFLGVLFVTALGISVNKEEHK